jgi:hypothetical protein
MPSDPERAQAIENSVARSLRYAAEEMAQSPDRASSLLQQALTQLNSDAAREHLAPEKIEALVAQVAEMQKKVEEAERAEKADRISRDIKRYISNAEEEIRTNGSQIESYLQRAANRLAAPEVRECLTAETMDQFQRQLAALQGNAGAPPEPVKAPTPTPAAAPAMAASPAPAAAAAPARAPSVDSERARLIEGEIARTLRFAANEIDGLGWQSTAASIDKVTGKLADQEVLDHLSPETVAQFRAQLTDLETKYAAHERESNIERIESMMQRLIGDAERNSDSGERGLHALQRAAEALNWEDTRKWLPTDKAENYRRDMARLEAAITGGQKDKAFAEAREPLEEFERRIVDLSFEGMSEYDEQKLTNDIEVFRNRAELRIAELPTDDSQTIALQSRLSAARDVIARASASAQRNRIAARVTEAFAETRQKIAGWEDETQDSSGQGLNQEVLPKADRALRDLNHVLTNDLFSPIPKAKTDYPNDGEIQSIIREAEQIRDAVIAKLVAAFETILQAAEQLPTPSNRLDRESAITMANRARSALENTPHADVLAARCMALLKKWEDALEADRAARQVIYDQLSTEASAAWPAIAARIEVMDGFDPHESGWHGKTVRISGVYNRIRWDFSGPFDYAVWVNGFPVVGNFDPTVRAAVDEAINRTGMAVDDHIDWDAFVVVGGPGKIKQRFNISVKDKHNLEIGKVEEWRPVDCTMCKVIALNAGPVAVGPA